MSEKKNPKLPCAECPFSRKNQPGKDLGGADPTVYVGQAFGPFVLSCHMDSAYEQSTALDKYKELRDCAGMAIYRANCGYDVKMPEAIFKLPVNKELVFSSPAEFLAHHLQIELSVAEHFLTSLPPEHWFKIELGKLTEKNFLK